MGKVISQLKWPLGVNLYLEKHRILYCPIAKCACSSLKSLMLNIAGYNIPQGVHEVLDSGEIKLQLRFYNETSRDYALDSDDVFRFAVIREPIERLISAYIEKFVINRNNSPQWVHTKPVIASVRGKSESLADVNEGISFREFIEYLLDTDSEKLDPHWRPQSHYLQGVRYTKIYKVDDLGKLKIDLSEHLGLEHLIPHKNKASFTEGSDIPVNPQNFVDTLPLDMNRSKLTKYNFLENDLFKKLKRKYSIDYAIYDSL